MLHHLLSHTNRVRISCETDLGERRLLNRRHRDGTLVTPTIPEITSLEVGCPHQTDPRAVARTRFASASLSASPNGERPGPRLSRCRSTYFTERALAAVSSRVTTLAAFSVWEDGQATQIFKTSIPPIRTAPQRPQVKSVCPSPSKTGSAARPAGAMIAEPCASASLMTTWRPTRAWRLFSSARRRRRE